MTTIDLEMNRGDTAEWTVTALRNGAPIVLTGGTVSMQASRNDASPALFTRTSAPGDGITIADQVATPGQASVKLRSLDTLALSNQDTVLLYSIRVITTDGDEWVVSTGNLTVSAVPGLP